MDYVNLSASMTMLELVRFLLQDSNNSFSFYSGKFGNLNKIKGSSEVNRHITAVGQYICKKVREVWTVQNIGIIAVNDGEFMICVTSLDPSVPAETVNFMVEAMAACSVNWTQGEESQEKMDEDVSPDLIQANASMKEINERIKQFMHYKREQANTNNVLDFCGTAPDRQMCARVDAVLVRKKDSSSHMAVRNILERYTTKHTMKKQAKMEKLASVTAPNQESLQGRSQSQILPPSNLQSDASCVKGEKRTFDIASLESMLSSVTKQQKL